jgi:hypothetical protein
VDKEFINPPRGMISHLIGERYPRSWALFRNMQAGDAQSMQYSSGIMSGDARVDVPQHLKPIMHRFPQMLWRWLYSNVADGAELFVAQPKEDKASGGDSKVNVFKFLKRLLG